MLIRLFVCLSFRNSVCLFVVLFVCMCVCLSVVRVFVSLSYVWYAVIVSVIVGNIVKA